MKIKPFQALYPDFERIASPDSFCENAKEDFKTFQADGLYEQYPQTAFYIYQMEDGHRRHTGLVALNEITDYFAGKIKKHENTLHQKEEQQMKFFLRWNAILKPVLLTYPTVPAIENWLHEYTDTAAPLFTTRFEKDGQVHRMWPVTQEKDIAYLQNLFAEHVQSTYIADGHHRTTAIALLHEHQRAQYPDYDFDHLFCIFLGAEELDILDYNRVVEGLKKMTPTQFVVRMSQYFEMEALETPSPPRQKHELTMYLRNEWYRLRWKKEIIEHEAPDRVLLDASLLNEWVLDKILGIAQVRSDRRISYIEGSRGIEGLQQATDLRRNRIGFMLFPVSFDDLVHVADAGESMPPKSTYFEPRIRTGMLVKSMKK